MRICERSMSRPLTIVVGGYIVALPLGGMTWHHLNYLLGLHELGHEVWFLEDSWSYFWPYDPRTKTCSADSSYGREYLRKTFEQTGLPLRYCYYSEFEDKHYGLSREELYALLKRADLLLCVSGVTPMREDRPRPSRTLVIDTDPVFTQLRMEHDKVFGDYYRWFDRAATFGRLIGQADCPIPTHGVNWIPTNQPISLRHWPVRPATSRTFTTIGKWEHSADRHISWRGRDYLSSKGVEWMKLIGLPSALLPLPGRERAGVRVDAVGLTEDAARQAPRPPDAQWQLKLAMQSMDEPTRRRFESAGWQITDGESTSISPESFQQFIADSAGEITVAKEIYTTLPSGWFSDRSAAYLATCRPVVTQDTGFNRWLPTGEGLFSFSSPDEAAAALNTIATDHPAHCRAARALAEAHFDSRKVLGELLERAM